MKKKFINLVFLFNINVLFIEPSSNVAVQAFRAFFVGAIAFICDGVILWVLSLTGLHYLICAVFGFNVGVTINFLISRKYVFNEKASINKFGEFIIYAVLSLIGLGLTALFMWLLTDLVGLYFMFSKCIAALLVFAWNFTVRKMILYRKDI